MEDEEFASNEDWAKGQFQLIEPEADSLTRSQKNGRLLSLVLEFEIPDLNPPVIRLGQPVLYLVTASVTLYGNLEGATADYQFFESKLDAFKEQQMQGMRESPLGFSNVRAEQGQVGSLGDQSFSLRFLADRRLFGTTVPLVVDATEFRRGQFLVIVVTGTTVRSDGTAAHELGETLVDRIDEKVKELQR